MKKKNKLKKGHGCQVPARAGNNFEADQKEETICPSDFVQNGMICDYDMK